MKNKLYVIRFIFPRLHTLAAHESKWIFQLTKLNIVVVVVRIFFSFAFYFGNRGVEMCVNVKIHESRARIFRARASESVCVCRCTCYMIMMGAVRFSSPSHKVRARLGKLSVRSHSLPSVFLAVVQTHKQYFNVAQWNGMSERLKTNIV